MIKLSMCLLIVLVGLLFSEMLLSLPDERNVFVLKHVWKNYEHSSILSYDHSSDEIFRSFTSEKTPHFRTTLLNQISPLNLM